MNSYINTIQRFTIVHEYFRVHPTIYDYMGRVPPPLWQKYAITNEFPHSCFANILDWERGVTLPWPQEVGHCLDPDESRVQ